MPTPTPAQSNVEQFVRCVDWLIGVIESEPFGEDFDHADALLDQLAVAAKAIGFPVPLEWSEAEDLKFAIYSRVQLREPWGEAVRILVDISHIDPKDQFTLTLVQPGQEIPKTRHIVEIEKKIDADARRRIVASLGRWRDEAMKLQLPTAAGDAPGEPALSGRQQDLLLVLLELEAFDSDSRQKTPVVAKRTDPKVVPEHFKEPIADLGRKGYVSTKEGRGGGIWLTPEGRSRAVRLSSKL